MSYFGSVSTGAIRESFAATPMAHDIAAMQSLYGAEMGCDGIARESVHYDHIEPFTGLAHATTTICNDDVDICSARRRIAGVFSVPGHSAGADVSQESSAPSPAIGRTRVRRLRQV